MTMAKPYLDDLIGSYFEMGVSALEKKEYAIAQKMFKAIFDEPGSKPQKEKIMLQLLIRSAEAHEGLKQLYKAKLLYIRALALLKKTPRTNEMKAVEILLSIAYLTAQQGLYRQALDFSVEAHESYKRVPEREKDAVDFVRRMRSVERIMQNKGRSAEQKRMQEILQEVRNQALSSLALPSFAYPTSLSASPA